MFVCSVAYTQERKHRRQIPLNLYELINEARDMRVNPINEATMAPAWPTGPILEHSNSRFESILFDSLCESILIDSFCKKSAFRFTSCHAAFLANLVYSLSQKNKLSLFAAFNTLEHRQKTVTQCIL